MKNKDIKNISKILEKNITYCVNIYSKITDNSKEEVQNDIRDFIEKMAVWYELRYSDSEIIRIFDLYEVNDDILKEIFNNNPNLKSNYEENLSWPNIYNFDVFYASLTDKEKKYIDKPTYPNSIRLYNKIYDRIYVSSDGFICREELIMLSKKYDFNKDSLKTNYIRDVINSFKKSLPKNSPVFKAMNLYENSILLRANILKCVMYRIMLRGDKKVSLRRAFLFSKEFENMYMTFLVDYAIYYEDYNLLLMMSEYLKSIGSEDNELNSKIIKVIKLTNLY